jgi:hypothetical protein
MFTFFPTKFIFSASAFSASMFYVCLWEHREGETKGLWNHTKDRWMNTKARHLGFRRAEKRILAEIWRNQNFT